MRFQKLFAVLVFSFTLLSLSLLGLQEAAQAEALPDTTAVLEEIAARVRLSSANLITVTTAADVIDANDNLCSLREAVISANTNPVGIPLFGECRRGHNDNTDRIVLANGVTYVLAIGGSDVHAQMGDLDISNNDASLDVEIIVANGGTATIEAQAINDRILELFGSAVSVNGVILRHGSAGDEGGAIKSSGIITLTNSEIVESQADYGGGISNSGQLTLINTSIIKNGATYEGGGIYNNHNGALVRLIGSQVRSNTSGDEGGGGIYNGQDGLLLVQNSVIHLNKSGHHGGGVYNYNGVVTITNSLLEGNRTPIGLLGGNGGAIYNENEGQVTVISATFGTANTANNGGAIFNEDSALFSLEDSLLENNKAGFHGGAIFNRGEMTLWQTTVQTNSAAIHGGGIYNAGHLEIGQRSNLYYNQAAAGSGGGFYQAEGFSVIRSSSLISNTSDTNGGGSYIAAGSNIFMNTTIAGNSAAGIGGGLYVGDTGYVQLLNVTIARNTAPASAGLYKTENGEVLLINSIISGQVGATCSGSAGVLNSFGHNLFRDGTCPVIVQPGDLIGLDPQLGELAEAEGTYFYRPQAGSPALEAGSLAGCAEVGNHDQLGTLRPIGPACDIGAIEGAIPDEGPGDEDEPTSQIFLPFVIK